MKVARRIHGQAGEHVRPEVVAQVAGSPSREPEPEEDVPVGIELLNLRAGRREIGDTRGVAGSLNNLGAIAHDRAHYGAAEAYFSDALPAWRQAGDQEGLALSLNNLGRTRRFQGDYAGAAALGRESLDLFQALAHSWGIAQALNSLANTAHYQGDVAGARPLSRRVPRLVADHQGLPQDIGLHFQLIQAVLDHVTDTHDPAQLSVLDHRQMTNAVTRH